MGEKRQTREVRWNHTYNVLTLFSRLNKATWFCWKPKPNFDFMILLSFSKTRILFHWIQFMVYWRQVTAYQINKVIKFLTSNNFIQLYCEKMFFQLHSYFKMFCVFFPLPFGRVETEAYSFVLSSHFYRLLLMSEWKNRIQQKKNRYVWCDSTSLHIGFTVALWIYNNNLYCIRLFCFCAIFFHQWSVSDFNFSKLIFPKSISFRNNCSACLQCC